MAMTFRYKKIRRPDGTITNTPSIPITLFGRKEEPIDVVALVDSGADISAMPRDIAELLDLDLSGKIEDSFGISGKTKTIESKITIRISKGHEDYRFLLPIKILLDKKINIPILLGREGFFTNFIVTFRERDERIILKRDIEN